MRSLLSFVRRRTARVPALFCGLVLGFLPGAVRAQADCDTKLAPAVSFSASCSGATCSFTLTSSAPSSGIANLDWDFGDGETVEGGPTALSHTYASAGYFEVSLTLTDGNGSVAVATGGVAVLGQTEPLAGDDAFSTPWDRPITISVEELLSNDRPGVRFDQATPAKCFVPAGASSCTYTPQAGLTGTDTFSYTVRDAANRSGTATVSITVTQPLIADPDEFTTPINTSIEISSLQLLQNDSLGALFETAEDPDRGSLQEVSRSAEAVLYRFSPEGGFVGQASFEYLISADGLPPFERGFVTIEVIDPAPEAIFTVSCANRVCTARTSSRDNGPLRYFWNWGDGTPEFEATTPYPWADQVHTYAQSGRYTITHRVVDSAGQTAQRALEALANTRPVAINDAATTERDIAVTIPILANDTDADGDALTIASVSLQHPGAAFQVVPAGGSWAIRITPPDTYVGTLTFTYVVSDRWGATATATVSLAVTQWTSVTDALGEQFYCTQNGSVRLPKSLLLSNDYDSDGDPLVITSIDTSILMGTLDCATEPNVCTYRPPLNALGYTLFRYTAADPAGHRDTATVRLYVGVRGSAPILADDYFLAQRNSSKVFTIQEVVQNDSDADGDTLTVTLISAAKDFGSLVCSNPMYSCSYTPNAGFVGTDRFSYTATDAMNPSASAMINVLTLPPVTPAFDARENMYIIGVGQQISISKASLVANDFDPESDPISVASVDSTGLQGTLTCDSVACTFKPALSFQGTTRFRYTASDVHGSTDSAIVKIRVGVGNSAPVVRADTMSTPKNTPLRFSVFELLKNDYDPDNDPLTVTVYGVTAQNGTLTCSTPAAYWCTYTPNPNVTGSDVITTHVGDAASGSSSTLTLNILP